MKRLMMLGGAPLLAVVMILAALFGLPMGAAADGEPPAGTVQNFETYTLYSQTVITTNSTYYSTGQRLAQWNSGDIFIVADVASGASFTVTAQVSPDNTNYADLDFEYGEADSLETKTYQRLMSADGVEVMRIPMAGEYLRVSIVTTGSVTPTVKVTMRNN